MQVLTVLNAVVLRDGPPSLIRLSHHLRSDVVASQKSGMAATVHVQSPPRHLVEGLACCLHGEPHILEMGLSMVQVMETGRLILHHRRCRQKNNSLLSHDQNCRMWEVRLTDHQ